MAKLPTCEEMGKEIAEKALETEYKGKTLREWIEQIAGGQIEGEWAWIADDSPMCNICGNVFDTNDNADAGTGLWKYCPNCGAHMKQSKDVTDIYVGGKSEWISVDERMPDSDGKYLVYTGEDLIHTMYYYATNAFGFEHWDVTHWMPLPEAPKMKGGAG